MKSVSWKTNELYSYKTDFVNTVFNKLRCCLIELTEKFIILIILLIIRVLWGSVSLWCVPVLSWWINDLHVFQARPLHATWKTLYQRGMVDIPCGTWRYCRFCFYVEIQQLCIFWWLFNVSCWFFSAFFIKTGLLLGYTKRN